MIKLLFKLIALAVVGILTFNFFFGSPEEKETSRRVVGQVRDLSASVFDLLKSEKEKYDQGKYDQALSKIKTAIGIEKRRASELGREGDACLQDCEKMEQEELDIERRLAELAANTTLTPQEQSAAMRAIRERILTLTNATQAVANKLK